MNGKRKALKTFLETGFNFYIKCSIEKSYRILKGLMKLCSVWFLFSVFVHGGFVFFLLLQPLGFIVGFQMHASIYYTLYCLKGTLPYIDRIEKRGLGLEYS